MNAALAERYRRARNVHEGYEIRTTEGQWLTVAHALHIFAPARIARFDLADGSAVAVHLDDEVMSRRPAGVA